jgi:hypothetical protein
MIACFLLTWPCIAPAAERPVYCGTARWESFIDEAAQRFDLPPDWLHTVMHLESAGCTFFDGRPTTSNAGAMGLMQLMPATWLAIKQQLGLGDDPHAPRDNIFAGAAYLRELLNRFGYPALFAAYHAGPQRYEAHRQHGRPLPDSTIEYLARMQSLIDKSPQHSTFVIRAPRDDDRSNLVSRKRDHEATDSSRNSHSDHSPFVARTHPERHVKRKTAEAIDVQKP